MPRCMEWELYGVPGLALLGCKNLCMLQSFMVTAGPPLREFACVHAEEQHASSPKKPTPEVQAVYC